MFLNDFLGILLLTEKAVHIYATSRVAQLLWLVAMLLIRLFNYKIILFVSSNDFYSSYTCGQASGQVRWYY